MSQVRRVWKYFYRSVLALLFLTVGVLVGVRLYLNDARLTAIASEQLKKHVPFPVAFEGIELSLLNGIVLRGVDVGPPNASYQRHVFTAKEMRVGYKLGPLLDKRLEIDTVCIVEPHATLEEKAGKWNVVALGEAFGPASPEQKPKDDSPPSDLPVAITLSRFCIDNLTLDVEGEQLAAHLDHFFVEARGSYQGLTSAKGEVEVDLGRADAPAQVTFAKAGLGQAALRSQSRITAKLADLKHVDATWALSFLEPSGTMSGLTIPTVPVGLSGEAKIDLQADSAWVPKLSFTMGKAITFGSSVRVSNLTDDPMITVRQTQLGVDLGTVTGWLPAGMLPASIAGRLSIDKLDLDGRQSALTAQQGFALELVSKLEGLDVRHPAATIDSGVLGLQVKTQPAAPVEVKLTLALPSVKADSALVEQTTVDVKVTGPHELLVQKLPTAMDVDGRVTVQHVASGEHQVNGTTLSFATTLQDLKGENVALIADLFVDKIQSTVKGQGTFTFPAQAHLDLVRQKQRFRFKDTVFSLSDWFKMALDGRVDLLDHGAMDTDLKLAMSDLVLTKMLASLPPEAKAQLGTKKVSGTLGADLRVFGRIPGNVAERFSGAPVDLAFAGTPFAVDLGLRFSAFDFFDGPTSVEKASGELKLSTRPEHLESTFKLTADSIDAGENKMQGLAMNAKVVLDDDEGKVDFAQSLEQVSTPTLSSPLLKQSLQAAVKYERGGDVTLEKFVVQAPSLGTKFTAKARLAEVDDVLEREWLADKTLSHIDADFSSQLQTDLPADQSPLKDNPMTLKGLLGFLLDVHVVKGLIKIDGALTSKGFSFSQPGMALKNMTGRMPFTQELRLDANGQPAFAWSTVDILKDNPRIAYYDELRSYRGEAYGLSIAELQSGNNVVSGIDVHGRWDRGAFYVDHYSMSLLNGDISGTLGFSLGADRAVRLAMTSVFSNLDLSVMAKTPPGPDSQLSGTMSAGLAFTERNTNVDAAFNLTTLGKNVLVQALLALDPQEKNQKTRENRQLIERTAIKIDLVEVTMRRNILKARLYYSFLLTTLTFGLYKPVDNDLLGPDGQPIELYLEGPAKNVNQYLGPYLGWSKPKASQP